MKMTKWILPCVLAISMTAATLSAQHTAPVGPGGSSAELEQLVDIAELDLLADMVGALLQDEDDSDGTPSGEPQTPESGFRGTPGTDWTGFYASFAMCGFGGFPTTVGFGGMVGFCGF